MPAPFQSHLESGERFDALTDDAPNLTAAWARRWREAPDARQLHDPETGWHSRGDLDAISTDRAGRLAALGLVSGDPAASKAAVKLRGAMLRGLER